MPARPRVPRAADPRRRDDVDEREDGEAARHELVGQVVEQTARRGRFAAQCPALIVLGLGREQSQSAPREDAADPRPVRCPRRRVSPSLSKNRFRPEFLLADQERGRSTCAQEILEGNTSVVTARPATE